LGGVQHLHPLATRADLIGEPLGRQLGVSHPGAGRVQDYRGNVRVPAQTYEKPGDRLSVIGSSAGAVVGTHQHLRAGNEIVDRLADYPLWDEQDVITGANRAIGSNVSEEAHLSLLST